MKNIAQHTAYAPYVQIREIKKVTFENYKSSGETSISWTFSFAYCRPSVLRCWGQKTKQAVLVLLQ